MVKRGGPAFALADGNQFPLPCSGTRPKRAAGRSLTRSESFAGS